MKIIYAPRGTGKTTEMIYEIFQKQKEGYNCYLICTNSINRNSIEAETRKLSMPFQNKPLLAETLMRQLYGEEPLNKALKEENVLFFIDDAENFIQSILPNNCQMITLSPSDKIDGSLSSDYDIINTSLDRIRKVRAQEIFAANSWYLEKSGISRCRQCTHFRKNPWDKINNSCLFHHYDHVTANGYCSYDEKEGI